MRPRWHTRELRNRQGERPRAYSRLRRREYTGLCLYTGEIEQLYDTQFAIVFRRHYGGLSQFLSPAPYVYEIAAAAEERLTARTADNWVAVSLVAQALTTTHRASRA